MGSMWPLVEGRAELTFLNGRYVSGEELRLGTTPRRLQDATSQGHYERLALYTNGLLYFADNYGIAAGGEIPFRRVRLI